MGQEGRGIGLAAKLHAYELQQEGLDTVQANEALGFPPDARQYLEAAEILRDLGLTTIRLMSNNPLKFCKLREHGITIVGRVPIQATPHPDNIRYLRTKRDKMHHMLDL
jgi:3,4-dihydroxy 2-butanone 4-phosphate synthase/GTP cyclohydrolase II